jgi:hypothetical protein
MEGPVPSPCTNVCTVDTRSGLCAGCLRTLDEIAAWSSLDDEAKRAVWKLLAARRNATARQNDPVRTDDAVR